MGWRTQRSSWVRHVLSWVTRGYEKGDEEGILDLLAAVWGERHSVEYWNWLYRENPDHYSIMRIAGWEDKPVAFVAAVPVTMKTRKEFAGYLVLHAATHPQHRGKGMMNVLAKELLAEAAARELAVGFYVTELGSPIEKVGVHVQGAQMLAGSMRDFFLILNLQATLKRSDLGPVSKLGAAVMRTTHRASKIQCSNQVTVEQQSGFDESFGELWNEVALSRSRALVIKRSVNYLTWRYSLHPENEYITWLAKHDDKPVGYLVARHDRTEDSHRGLIADIFGFSQRKDALRALVSNVVQYFREQNAELVRCQLSHGHPLTGILEDVGFASRPAGRSLGLTVLLPTAGVDQASVLRKENHMVTWGDAHADSA